jgi:hypothetical protein
MAQNSYVITGSDWQRRRCSAIPESHCEQLTSRRNYGAAICDQADTKPDLLTKRTFIDLIPLGKTMTYLPDFEATTVRVEIFLPILV